jgi:hypothetical protein
MALSPERSGNRRILRMAAVHLGIRIMVVHGRTCVLGLERCWRQVMLVHGSALFRRGSMADAAWTTIVRDVGVVDDGGALNDRPVDIDAAAPSAANADVHDRTVIREHSAAPAKPTPM